MEDKSCRGVQLPTTMYQNRGPGTKGASSGKNARSYQNKSGRYALAWNWQTTLRDLALFNVAIDSKLRGCDLVRLKVSCLVSAGEARSRASVVQSKTKRPVQFELSENTRSSVMEWVGRPEMFQSEYMFPSRFHDRPHISTRQFGRIVRAWVKAIGLEPSGYGTHSMRRTKAAEIYRKTGNLRAVQLLLGHTKVDSTVRYLGVELEDALSIAENIDI